MEPVFLVLLLGVAGSALSLPHSDQQNDQMISSYLINTIRNVQFYRQEIQRQMGVLTRLADSVREHPTRERAVLLASLFDRLGSTYQQFDESIDIFIPSEDDISRGIYNDADDSEDAEDAKISKRFTWPKRMYSAAAKYNKIPVIRTGK